MSYKTILFEVSEGVATITLNRPERYNALTIQMYEEIQHALKQCARNNEIRAVMLTGSGKAFTSGADLVELQANLGTFDISDMLRIGLNRIVTAIRTLEKPVVAVVNGVVAGAGGGLALACDMRLASDKATFVFAAFARIGIIPDAGTTYSLTQLVGTSKALELAMFADGNNRVTAEEALRLGIVNRVVPHEDLEASAREMGIQMAKMATKAIGLTKRSIYAATDRTLKEALENEAALQSVTFKTHDFQEGVMAFIQKRDPEFKGE